MKRQVLIINVCKERLHYFEFVKPVERIVRLCKKGFFVRGYMDVSKEDIDKAGRIIICGTSLMDSEYLNSIKRFKWLGWVQKPVLGICAGMQIICKNFGCKLVKKCEIGLKRIYFKQHFFGMSRWQEVYLLYNLSVKNDNALEKNFDIFSKSKKGDIVYAIKHKTKELYGVLFHPEVRHEEMIINFINLRI